MRRFKRDKDLNECIRSQTLCLTEVICIIMEAIHSVDAVNDCILSLHIQIREMLLFAKFETAGDNKLPLAYAQETTAK